MATNKKKSDPLQIIAGAKLAETTVELCLRGDLTAQHSELQRQLEAEHERADERLTGNPEAKKLAQRIEKLEGEMRDSTITFHFRAMPSHEYIQFLGKHPPREKDQIDHALGYNRETYFEALTRRCLIDPVLDDEAWGKLQAALTAKQWDVLTDAANSINTEDIDVPFSAAASQLLQPSVEQ